jgi:hypothetical protein
MKNESLKSKERLPLKALMHKAIINKASLVQVYMQTKIRNKKDLDILGMQVVWPPVFSGKVIFTAQKTFTGSEVRGRLGFKIG